MIIMTRIIITFWWEIKSKSLANIFKSNPSQSKSIFYTNKNDLQVSVKSYFLIDNNNSDNNNNVTCHSPKSSKTSVNVVLAGSYYGDLNIYLSWSFQLCMHCIPPAPSPSLPVFSWDKLAHRHNPVNLYLVTKCNIKRGIAWDLSVVALHLQTYKRASHYR